MTFHFDMEKKIQRTNQQNKALHKYFELLAGELNGAGLEMKIVLPPIDVPWTPVSVKECLWRPFMNAMYVKKSTAEMTTDEVGDIYKTLDRYLSQEHHLHLEFPNE